MASAIPTPMVVNPGLKWSQQAAIKAQEKAQFLRVGGVGVTKRYLSGAKRSWSSADPNEYRTIFSLTYRLTGVPENVAAALRYAGVDEGTINTIIGESVTRDNFATTMADYYNNELAYHASMKQTEVKPTAQTPAHYQWYVDQIKAGEYVCKNKAGGAGCDVKGTSRGVRSLSIVERYRALKAGSVLNVSGLDAVTGSGIRTISRPKTTKTKLFGTMDIPIVSDNVAAYVRALELIFGEAEAQQYRGHVQQVADSIARTQCCHNPTANASRSCSHVHIPQSCPGMMPVQYQAPPQFAQGVVPSVASPLRVQGGTGFSAMPSFATR